MQFLEVSTLQGPELHLDVSALQRGVYCSWRCLHYRSLSCIWTCLQYRGVYCSWRCLHYRGLSCIWTCLHYRGVYCSWRCLPQRPELNLDMSALQRYVSNPQGPVHTYSQIATPRIVDTGSRFSNRNISTNSKQKLERLKY